MIASRDDHVGRPSAKLLTTGEEGSKEPDRPWCLLQAFKQFSHFYACGDLGGEAAGRAAYDQIDAPSGLQQTVGKGNRIADNSSRAKVLNED